MEGKYFVSLISNDLKGIICIGYTDTLMKAELLLQVNSMGILNNSKYAVIENVKEGLFMYDEKPLFYEIDEKLKTHRLVQIPQEFRHKKGIGFGVKLN